MHVGGAWTARAWSYWRGASHAFVQVVPVPVDDLLSKEYAKKRRAELYLPNKVNVRLLLFSHCGSSHCLNLMQTCRKRLSF